MMRATYPVVWFKYSGIGYDDYGNEVESWADGVEVKAYGLRYPDSAEPIEAGHNRLVVDCVLLVPRGFEVAEKDRFNVPRLNDGLFEVIGMGENADGNPFGWNPGGHVKLRLIEG